MRLSELAVDQIDSSVSMISLRGEHDLNTAQDLRDAITGVQQQGAGVVLDLSKTTFVDSSILAALVEAQRGAKDAGLGLAVYTGERMSDGVSRIFGVTGLDEELPLVGDREAAIAAARNGAA